MYIIESDDLPGWYWYKKIGAFIGNGVMNATTYNNATLAYLAIYENGLDEVAHITLKKWKI